MCSRGIGSGNVIICKVKNYSKAVIKHYLLQGCDSTNNKVKAELSPVIEDENDEQEEESIYLDEDSPNHQDVTTTAGGKCKAAEKDMTKSGKRKRTRPKRFESESPPPKRIISGQESTLDIKKVIHYG